MSEPRATAVVVAYGVTELNLDWLPQNDRLIVVHNDHRLGDVVGPNIRNIRGQGNVGFGAAVNLALPHVSTGRVVLVNPDVRMTREHWNALVNCHEKEIGTIPLSDSRGQATVVASRYPNAALAMVTAFQLGRRVPTLQRRRRSRLSTVVSEPLPLSDYWASAACLSIPTSALRKVGGFEESFFLYFEDIDLCRRLASSDPALQIRVAPIAPATHAVGATATTVADRRRVRAARIAGLQTLASRQQGVAWRAVGLIARFGAGEVERLEAPVDAVILSLGRPGAMGERRRAESWKLLLGGVGVRAHHIDLLKDCRRRVRPPTLRSIAALGRGQLQPEALSWSVEAVNRRLVALSPDLVVCVSGRAFHPDLVANRLVLDYVDRLSVSYVDRAKQSSRLAGQIAFSVLSRAAARFEAVSSSLPALRVAAGITDAHALKAHFLPVVVELPSIVDHQPDTDLLFFGTLNYPPNVAALEQLGAWWPELQRRRPGTSLLLAGSQPGKRIRSLAHRHNWRLVPDFEDLITTLARATIAVAPLPFASGIQIKLIEAAAAGLPQVVTPAAVQGLPPGLPAVVTPERSFLDAVVTLLGDRARQAQLASASPHWAEQHFSRGVLVPLLRTLLEEMPARFSPECQSEPSQGRSCSSQWQRDPH